MGGIEPAGLGVFPQHEDEGVLMPGCPQPGQGLFKEPSAVALAPLRRVGVKGDDLSPALISSGVELAHRTCLETCIDPGGAEGGTADGNILIV